MEDGDAIIRANNREGRNGHNNGTVPSDDDLERHLRQYAKENLTLEARITRLGEDLTYHIRLTKLKALNKKFKIPTARKPPPQEAATQLVADQASVMIGRGVGSIRDSIRNLGEYNIPRDTTRAILRDNFSEGLDQRYPGAKQAKKRTPLLALGVFHQIHADGHEKLGAQALKMGDVSLPIYGLKDQWSAGLLHLVVVPNARLAQAIGHVFLDFVDEYGGIPLQMTVDKGSELGDMYSFQTAFRTTYAPDIDETQFPPWVAIPSTKNTPIEGLWRWLLNHTGRALKDIIRSGHFELGIFDPSNAIHIKLFHWLWPPIVQALLDEFVVYWNNHKIRKQANKLNPSGTTPMNAFSMPHEFGGKMWKIAVPPEAVRRMREERLTVTRDEAFRFVDADFAELADAAYALIGSPKLNVTSAWEVFRRMAIILK